MVVQDNQQTLSSHLKIRGVTPLMWECVTARLPSSASRRLCPILSRSRAYCMVTNGTASDIRYSSVLAQNAIFVSGYLTVRSSRLVRLGDVINKLLRSLACIPATSPKTVTDCSNHTTPYQKAPSAAKLKMSHQFSQEGCETCGAASICL